MENSKVAETILSETKFRNVFQKRRQANDKTSSIRTLFGQDNVKNTLNIKSSERRPIWFVFENGQPFWPDIISKMKLPVIEATMHEMAEALKPHNVDLLKIVNETNHSEDLIENIVTLVALHIAVVDFLKEIGIKPDGLIGHSLGEIGCSYADGLLTAKQAILCAYWCGRMLEETDSTKHHDYKINLKKVIPNFKPKPAWWISAASSNKRGKICNAEYFLDSLCLPIETEALKTVPKDSILLEMGSKQLSNWISNYMPSSKKIEL